MKRHFFIPSNEFSLEINLMASGGWFQFGAKHRINVNSMIAVSHSWAQCGAALLPPPPLLLFSSPGRGQWVSWSCGSLNNMVADVRILISAALSQFSSQMMLDHLHTGGPVARTGWHHSGAEQLQHHNIPRCSLPLCPAHSDHPGGSCPPSQIIYK